MLITDTRDADDRKAARMTRKTATVAEILSDKDDLFVLLEEFLDTPRPASVLILLINGLRTLIERLETSGFTDPTSLMSADVIAAAAVGDDAPRRVRAALTSDSTDDALLAPLHEMAAGMGAENTEAFVESLKKIFNSIIEAGQTDPDQIKARLNTVLRVAVGNLVVGNDERLESERLYDEVSLELTRIAAQLATTDSKLRTATARQDEIRRKIGDIDLGNTEQVRLLKKVVAGTLDDKPKADSATVTDLRKQLEDANKARQEAERKFNSTAPLLTQANTRIGELERENEALKATPTATTADDATRKQLEDADNAVRTAQRTLEAEKQAAKERIERAEADSKWFREDFPKTVAAHLREPRRTENLRGPDQMVFDPHHTFSADGDTIDDRIDPRAAQALGLLK